MTSTDFIGFSINERKLILRTGIFLNEVMYPNFRIQFYSVFSFFVEVKIFKGS